MDHQIKLRGHRIEPGDIEGVLVGHESVGQAIVLAREDRPGDRRLVAYVTTVPGAEVPTASELRTMTGAALPKHMVPSAFIVLPGFPLNYNGKVDRAALPAPSGVWELDESSRQPATEMERELARLWEDVLAVTGIGADDDFFDLGGHSLLLTRLLSRVAETFGVRLALRNVFENPTIAGFVGQLENGVGGAGGVRAAPGRGQLATAATACPWSSGVCGLWIRCSRVMCRTTCRRCCGCVVCWMWGCCRGRWMGWWGVMGR